jgi:spore maturation protein CgeB
MAITSQVEGAALPASRLNIVVLGLSLRSSWGNGHATTYRSLLGALARRGHRITFLERDTPWYAQNSDLPNSGRLQLELYADLADLSLRFSRAVHEADVVIVGSYTPEGVAVGQWVCETATGIKIFYDIDTPITLDKLSQGDTEYLSADVMSEYDLYLSFTGGPMLDRLLAHGARAVRTLYCTANPESYFPDESAVRWDLGYMGTYSADRANHFRELLLEPARRWRDGRMIVAGPMYPSDVRWPYNVAKIEHLPPGDHRAFYNSLAFTLNLTRAAMRIAGYAPSVRLFEAAACGCPIITDNWDGIEAFFSPGEEILIARTADEVLHYLTEMPESRRKSIGRGARERFRSDHSADIRARQFEQYLSEL